MLVSPGERFGRDEVEFATIIVGPARIALTFPVREAIAIQIAVHWRLAALRWLWWLLGNTSGDIHVPVVRLKRRDCRFEAAARRSVNASHVWSR